MRITCRDCDRRMERCRRGPVRFWRCGGCGAHALTPSALRRILVPEAWPETWQDIREAAAPGTRGCPTCTRSMDRTRGLAEAGGMRLDFCGGCRVIWFDPRELERVPKVPVPPEVKLPPDVARAFALAQVELINMEYDAREAAVFEPLKRLGAGLFGALLTAMLRRS